jgi:tetratricopeptide (TPR) repeat protein
MSVSVRVGGVSARRARRERAFGAAAAALVVALSGVSARAESPSPKAATAEITRADRAQALHDEAAALYERGEYRVAIDKLEEALKLDPSGRELVYNLALIHERLGDIDAAEGYYRRYLEMEKDARVRDKVHATLKRLEGARKELARGGTPAPIAAPRALEAAPPIEALPEPPQRRRYTGWVILLTSVAGTGLVASTGFGISAIAHNPGGSARTGGGVSIGDLQANAATAHRDAVVADISFLTGAIAGAAAVYLFVVGRPSRAPDPLAGMRRPSGAATWAF